MKLAYLIRAHRDPAQLARLIEALRYSGTRFFIHIDRKVDQAPFEDILSKAGDVHFIRNRTELNWGGFSMVEATLRSLREMLEEVGDASPDYIALLSGQDYPIKSNAEIHDFFETHRGKDFLSYAKIPAPFWGDLEHQRITKFNFYNEKILTWPANKDGRIGDRKTLRLYIATKLASWLLPERRPPPGWEAYGGSAWWCLSRETTEYVVRKADESPELANFFRWTLHPEEMFFQTLLVNSPHADRLVGEYLEDKLGDYLWYQNWGSAPRPEVLTVNDFDAIRHAERLFARKFDPAHDSRILDMIDEARSTA